MIAQNACFTCLQNQVQYLCSLLQRSDSVDIAQKINAILDAFKAKNLMPPQIAISVYEAFRESANLDDPFLEIKRTSITKAHAIVQNLLEAYPAPILESTLEHTKDLHTQSFSVDSIFRRLDWAIRIAILGNVIDYGSQHHFDFTHTNFDLKNLQFAYFDLSPFIAQLTHAQTLLYLADNAGENCFDEVLLHSLKSIYPHLQIYYALRGEPIINDLTLKDLSHPLAQSIQNYCTLLDSGVKSPGFIYEDANKPTQAIYDNADVIVAKGMGNFECLHMCEDKRLFFLFKVKCDVVAKHCNVQKGKMMFIHSLNKGEIC